MMIAINNSRFIVLSEKLRGKIFEISKDEMSIGSHDGNDICIDDASVSEHHADIFRREINGKIVCVLRENNSLNGIRINNVAITGEQVLKNSDIIQFGEIEVLFDSCEPSIEERCPTTKPLKPDVAKPVKLDALPTMMMGVIRSRDFDFFSRPKKNFLSIVKKLLKRRKQ